MIHHLFFTDADIFVGGLKHPVILGPYFHQTRRQTCRKP